MEAATATTITVESIINAPVEKVWQYFNDPQHIIKWNSPSEDWHTPTAQNDLKPGGAFTYRMEAKDGSFGFDFGGTFDDVTPNKRLAYTLGDGRKVDVGFSSTGNQTKVVETFDPENINSLEMQRGGWQAILDNFKKYVEAN